MCLNASCFSRAFVPEAFVTIVCTQFMCKDSSFRQTVDKFYWQSAPQTRKSVCHARHAVCEKTISTWANNKFVNMYSNYAWLGVDGCFAKFPGRYVNVNVWRLTKWLPAKTLLVAPLFIQMVSRSMPAGDKMNIAQKPFRQSIVATIQRHHCFTISKIEDTWKLQSNFGSTCMNASSQIE